MIQSSRMYELAENTGYIRHVRRDGVYQIIDVVKMKSKYGWVDACLYRSVSDDALYCRNIDEFTGFVEEQA